MYDSGYGSETVGVITTLFAIFGLIWLVVMIGVIFCIICMWKIFTKAGKPGWAAVVPIYNIIVLLEIVELPLWYIALFFIPFANIYAIFKIFIELAHKFEKSTGFGVATVFFSIICFPILAFGNAQYKGSSNVITNNNVYTQTNTNYSQQISNQNGNMQAMNVNSSQPVNPQIMNNGFNNQQTTNYNMNKTCSNCGSQMDINSSFCTNCGQNMQ